MATKAKKKVHPMPKLGFLDQMIYMAGYLLILAVLVGLYWFRFIWIEERMLQQPGAVAYEAAGTVYWMLPFYLCLMLSLFIPWYSLHQKRYPFFGKRGIKYGPPAYPRTFPLFMKNKPQYWKSPSQARMRRAGVIAVVALNLVLALLMPLSIYGRDMLYEDGNVVEYGVFNNTKRAYEPEDAETVTLSIGWHRSGRHSYGNWRLTVSLDYGQRRYRFYERSFGSDWVDDLTAVLERFDPGILRTNGEENLEDFLRGLSPENAQKLRELFGSIDE